MNNNQASIYNSDTLDNLLENKFLDHVNQVKDYLLLNKLDFPDKEIFSAYNLIRLLLIILKIKN